MKRFLCAVLCTAMILSAGAVSIFAGFGENNLAVSQTVNLGNDYTVGDADSNGQVNSEKVNIPYINLKSALRIFPSS